MSSSSSFISTKVYRKTKKGLTATVDLDFETLQVFTAINGQSQLSAVAQQAGVSIPALWKAIAKLTRLGLIESGASANNLTMGKSFADKLHKELTKAVGPMSNLLITNVVKITNITWPHIPRNRARELIYRLVVQIPNDNLKDKFQKTMLKEL
jgi:hypothetical protein